MIQALENGEKPRFGPDLDPLGLKSGRVFFFFFFQNFGFFRLTRYHGQQSSCTISEKTNDLILTKLSEEQTGRGPDRRTRVIS